MSSTRGGRPGQGSMQGQGKDVAKEEGEDEEGRVKGHLGFAFVRIQTVITKLNISLDNRVPLLRVLSVARHLYAAESSQREWYERDDKI